jgi:hypothetical protein
MARGRSSKRIRRPLAALADRLAGAEAHPAPALAPGEPPPPAGDLDALRKELAALRRADEELAKAVHGLAGAALAVDLASLREEVRGLRAAEQGAADAARDFPLEQVTNELTTLREELAALRFTQQGTARGVRDEGSALRQAQERATEGMREELGGLREELARLPASHEATVAPLRDQVSGLGAAQEATSRSLHDQVSGLAASHETTVRSLRDEVGVLMAAQEAAGRALRAEMAALGAAQAAGAQVVHERIEGLGGVETTARELRTEVAGMRQSQEDSVRATAASVSALGAAQEATAQALREELGALRRDQERAVDAVEGLRGLSARRAERDGRWPERLAALRASREWRWAYSEREPLVTVRIATYNRAATLCDRAIASVLRQSYERWEIVVVGDGCTDDTAERIAALGHPRIRYRNLPAHGPYPDEARQRRLVAGVQAMNAGAHMAEGTWIAPLQDDDEWTDDHLEVLVAAALDQQAEVAYGRWLARLEDPPLETQVGDWPPSPSGFSWQAAIYNTALREFDLDMAARFVGEPAEWNLARRMWEAGVSFFFVDRVVGTQNVHPTGAETVEWFRARGAQSPANSVPAS